MADHKDHSKESEDHYKINITKHTALGDAGTVHIESSFDEEGPDGNEALDERIREQARIDCRTTLVPVDLKRPIVPVNLHISSEQVRASSELDELDEEGHFHRRKDFVKLYEQPPENFSETEVFQYPKHKAEKEAEKMFKTNNERKDYVAKHGNIIGVVGQPGIGKTTTLKNWVMQILCGKLLPNVTFIFFIFLRNIDFSVKMTVLEFLVSTVLPDWKHYSESDRAWLEKIFRDRNAVIALDRFDEAAVEYLGKIAPKINLYDMADPLTILLNLINGNLFPFARVIITSRPKALDQLHPDHRPRFVVQVLGLNQQEQDDIGRQICGGRYEKIRGIMLNNPDVFAYCYVPVNCILTFFFLMTCKSDIEFLCMSHVLSFVCVKYSRSDHLRDQAPELMQLSKLALNGFEKMQTVFKEADFKKANLDAHTVQSFMNTSVVGSAKTKITIMEGNRRSYFSHLIWQEYFAAMCLMLFASDGEFEASLEHLFDDRWQNVIKFLFGLCNHEAYGQVQYAIPTHCTNAHFRGQWKKKKKKLLNVATRYLAEQYPKRQVTTDTSNKEKWQNLLYLCSWVHEAHDKDMTRTVAAHFPDSITMSGTIIPNDIFHFFYVLRAARRLPSLLLDECKFLGDASTRFWREVDYSSIKIQLLNLREITDDAFSLIIDHLPSIQKLKLNDSIITSTAVEKLARKLIATEHELDLLDLSGNFTIGDDGAIHLVPCLHLIKTLQLNGCNVSEAVHDAITSKHYQELKKQEESVEIAEWQRQEETSGDRSKMIEKSKTNQKILDLICVDNLDESNTDKPKRLVDAIAQEKQKTLNRFKAREESGLLLGQTSASVGPGGVTLSAGRCQIVVPEGALEEEVIITLTPRYYGNDATGRITPVLQCEPHGLEFKKSVEIILPTCFFPDEEESVTAIARQSKNGIDWDTIKELDHRMERFFSFSTECFSLFDVISKTFGWHIEKCFKCEVLKTKSIDCDKLYVTCHIDDDIQGSKNNEDSPTKLDQTFVVRPNDEYIIVSLSNETMEIDPLKSCCEDVRNRRWKSTFHLKKKSSSLLDEKVEVELSTANGSVFTNQLFTSSDHLFIEQSSDKVKPSSQAGDTAKYGVNFYGPTSNVTVGTKSAVTATDESLCGEQSDTTAEQLHKSNNQRRMDLTHCETLSSQPGSSSAAGTVERKSATQEIAENENSDDSDS